MIDETFCRWEFNQKIQEALTWFDPNRLDTYFSRSVPFILDAVVDISLSLTRFSQSDFVTAQGVWRISYIFNYPCMEAVKEYIVYVIDVIDVDWFCLFVKTDLLFIIW